MKINWKWIVGVAVALFVLLALPILFRSYGYNGMMGGYGGWRHPMMGGYGLPFVGSLWMGFGMLFIWAIPLGLLFLVIYGAVRMANKPNLPATAQKCPNCGQAVQAGWKNCPHCGTGL